ncbi:hypothetical protein TL16_g02414 [Triparma laevis f. inornata]|uniref:FAD dependent oxidoreductase domain-containing protein n=1 Tax=Triparma laevis f. inornata TaxID=1714386 RepID=A0A9W7DWG1_9STRA|nr:hypothetical protein TL16_g02414 [Triparma laevis f. inornata]
MCSHASGHNSGIACTGVDAPVGSLERGLVRESMANMRPWLDKMNLPYRAVGSLVADWEESEGDNTSVMKKLSAVVEESHIAGDCDVVLIHDRESILKLEPHVNKAVSAAVHIKGETVVDPWLIPMSYASHAVENGAIIKRGFQVTEVSFDSSSGVWKVTSKSGEVHFAKIVVSCVGNWGDEMFGKLKGKPAHFVNKPRKGQYTLFERTEGMLKRPLQPVPTDFTKGVFVFSTLYDNIVCGPTAEVQENILVAELDEATLGVLKETGVVRVPGLVDKKIVRSYAGLRPATSERDYQFQLDAKRNFLSVASIRSTGLTASLGIGRHAASLLSSVFDFLEVEKEKEIRTTSFKDVGEFIKEFRERGDGKVEIPFLGECVVTHPITQTGWGL